MPSNSTRRDARAPGAVCALGRPEPGLAQPPAPPASLNPMKRQSASSAKFVEALENASAGNSMTGPVKEVTSAPSNASTASPTQAFAIPSIVPPSIEGISTARHRPPAWSAGRPPSASKAIPPVATLLAIRESIQVLRAVARRGAGPSRGGREPGGRARHRAQPRPAARRSVLMRSVVSWALRLLLRA